MLATYPIYFLDEAQEELKQLREEFDDFEVIWVSVEFCLKKFPDRCGAKPIGDGNYLKKFQVNIPSKRQLSVVFKYDNVSVNIVAVRYLLT